MQELVIMKKGEAVCSSLQVAEVFEKRHDNILRDIKGLLNFEETHGMFQKSTRVDKQNGQTYPMYYMNRDGFSLLVMGFTGKKALEWKLKYIKAFHQMEDVIKQSATKEYIKARKDGKLTRKQESDVLKDLVEYAKGQGSKHPEKLYVVYSNLANKTVGIQNRRFATPSQLRSLALVESIMMHTIQLDIKRQMHYKDIYKDCKAKMETLSSISYLAI